MKPEVRLTTTFIEGWALATGGFVDDEPRVRDIDLAERLEYERPRDVRRLIVSLERAGKLNNIAHRDVAERAEWQVATRPVTEFWLTEAQALKVVAKSETAKADALLDEVIRVFVLARRGQLQGAAPDIQRTLNDPASLRQLLLENVEKVIALEAEATVSRPKVEVYDRIIDSGDTVGFRQACKLIFAGTGAKEHEVREFLLRARWIQRLGGRLAPASYGQQNGYVTSRDRELPGVTNIDGGPMVVPELRVTQRGVARAIERLNAERAA